MIVTTKSGTKYKIDLEAKTWERISSTERSGPLCTESGQFLSIGPYGVGTGMLMVCPPLREGSTHRLIYTSDVVSVEEE